MAPLSKEDKHLIFSLPSIPILLYLPPINYTCFSYSILYIFPSRLWPPFGSFFNQVCSVYFPRVPYIMHPMQKSHPIDPVSSWVKAMSLLRQVVAFPWGLDSTPGQWIWGSWWTVWHWGRISLPVLRFSPVALHQCSILITFIHRRRFVLTMDSVVRRRTAVLFW